MSNTVSGLLSQKPLSPYGDPAVGQTRYFETEQRPKKSGEGTWTKLKNSKEGHGQAFKVLKADRLDDYNGGQHGPLEQYSLLLEPLDIAPANGNGSAPSGDREESMRMAFAGTFNAAVALTAAGLSVTPAEMKRIEDWMNALRPIRSADPKGPWMEAEEASAVESQGGAGAGAAMDSDIPFA